MNKVNAFLDSRKAGFRSVESGAAGGGRIGRAASKILNRPDLCNEICADAIPWLHLIQAMMTAYFHIQKE